MSLIVAIQMDPIDAIDIKADSTFILALEAQARGHSLYHYLPQDLALQHGCVIAGVRPLNVKSVKGDHFTLGEKEWVELATVDVVLMRQDPPFNMAYITATHLLEHIHPETLVVNDPVSVRNAPEKLFITHFPEFMPPTLISSNREQIIKFREHHRDIVMKPLFGNGGDNPGFFASGATNTGSEAGEGMINDMMSQINSFQMIKKGKIGFLLFQ